MILTFFDESVLGSSFLGDIGEESVGEEGPILVDTVCGLLNVPTGFFSVSDTISISVTPNRSTSKLVTIRYESIEVFSSFLTFET